MSQKAEAPGVLPGPIRRTSATPSLFTLLLTLGFDRSVLISEPKIKPLLYIQKKKGLTPALSLAKKRDLSSLLYIANANIPSDLQVFLGAEAEMTGFNQFSITKDFAETLDFVLMPHNHIHQNYIKKPAICTAENLINFLLDRFSICAKSGLATIMAHPMLPYGFMEFFAPGILNCSEQKMIDIYGLAAERNIFFELNSDYF